MVEESLGRFVSSNEYFSHGVRHCKDCSAPYPGDTFHTCEEVLDLEAKIIELRHELNSAASIACIYSHALPGTSFGQCQKEICLKYKRLIDGK